MCNLIRKQLQVILIGPVEDLVLNGLIISN